MTNTKQNLYHVQDPDRPLWVVAASYAVAVERWKEVIALENEQSNDDAGEPAGVVLICEGDELLLPGTGETP